MFYVLYIVCNKDKVFKITIYYPVLSFYYFYYFFILSYLTFGSPLNLHGSRSEQHIIQGTNNRIHFSEAFLLITIKQHKVATCLHFGLPWECSNSVPPWQCSPNAARCPARRTSGCILPVSSNVPEAPRLDGNKTRDLSRTG